MTNIRCVHGKEIDLLAINPTNGEKYHVESRISTAFKLKERATRKRNGTSHKDGLDYFKAEKFEHQAVLARIKELFGDLNYSKVLVVYDTEKPTESFIPKAFKESGIQILLMKDIIADLKEQVKVKGSRDDIMRFIELIVFEERGEWKESLKQIEQAVKNAKHLPNDKRKSLLKASQTLKKGFQRDRKTSTRIFRENMNARQNKM
jgi:hypothetical protein